MSHARTIQWCYETDSDDLPSGKVVTHIVVGPDGSVQSAAVSSSTLRTPTIETCMVRQIRKWTFPPRPARSVVDFPFFFKGRPN
jgi:outer membrane biosynthesis protein TonB